MIALCFRTYISLAYPINCEHTERAKYVFYENPQTSALMILKVVNCNTKTDPYSTKQIEDYERRCKTSLTSLWYSECSGTSKIKKSNKQSKWPSCKVKSYTIKKR